MESQLQHTHHTHGRHYDDQDPLTAGHLSGHDHSEEHHGEKKSVIKKVKEKAKKLKNTITKHGHGHGGHDHHHHDDVEDDDDDDELEEDAEVHGAPMYDSARVGQGGPTDSFLAQPRGNLERPSVMAEDRYVAPPRVNLSDPQGYGDVNPEKWRGKIGQPTGMEEVPFAPNPTRIASPVTVTDPRYGTTDPFGNRGSRQDVSQEGLRDRIEKSTGMVEDPHAPKYPSGLGSAVPSNYETKAVPSNYETKVTDPTHTGGKEAEVSQIRHSLGKMGIQDEHDSGLEDEPKTLDHNHPENLPRDTVTGNPSSHTSSYTDKISSSASAIADKAAVAKDVIASKLGYSSQNPSTEHHDTAKSSSGAADYAHKITDTVTGTLAPVYEKVMDAGSAVMSKVQESVSGTGHPQVQRVGSDMTSGTATVERGREADKGVSVKEYLVETLKPGEEDKALSDVITHAFHRGSHGESEKKSGEDRPIARVTESVEVRERLGTDRREEHSGNVTADKGVTERLSAAFGSWLGGKGNAPEGSLGTSYVTDEGLSSNPAGDHKRESARER